MGLSDTDIGRISSGTEEENAGITTTGRTKRPLGKVLSPERKKNKKTSRRGRNQTALPPPPSPMTTTCRSETSSNPVQTSMSQPLQQTAYSSTFATPNPFAPLTSRVEEQEMTETAVRPPKPPPIYVYKLTHYVDLCSSLVQLIGKDTFTCKSRSTNTMISTTTVEAYRAVVKYLRERGEEFHTYQLKQEKAYRVVLRHLHHSTPPEAIKSELENLGFPTRQVTNVLHPGEKTPLPLFFVDLEPAANNSDIFKINTLLYTRVKVEEPHQTKDIVQCKRCQQYGHSKGYCYVSPRCVKCAGEHLTSSCGKTRDTPATCVLCQGQHPANYKGCMTHKELQRQRRAGERERGVQQPAAAPRQRVPPLESFPPLQQRYQPAPPPPPQHQSYAEITRPIRHIPPSVSYIPPPPASSDITSLLTTFLSDFKSLITPLITLLTTMVSELLPRLTR